MTDDQGAVRCGSRADDRRLTGVNRGVPDAGTGNNQDSSYEPCRQPTVGRLGPPSDHEGMSHRAGRSRTTRQHIWRRRLGEHPNAWVAQETTRRTHRHESTEPAAVLPPHQGFVPGDHDSEPVGPAHQAQPRRRGQLLDVPSPAPRNREGGGPDPASRTVPDRPGRSGERRSRHREGSASDRAQHQSGVRRQRFVDSLSGAGNARMEGIRQRRQSRVQPAAARSGDHRPQQLARAVPASPHR